MGYAVPEPRVTELGSGMHLVRKTYLTMFGGLALATLSAYWSAFFCPLQHIWALAWGGLAVIMLWRALIARMNFPLFAFSSLWMGALTGIYYPLLQAEKMEFVLWQALAITVTSFGSLTVYVWTSKKDFDWMGGMLYTTLWGMIIVGFAGMFFGMSEPLHFLYSFVGLLMVTGYVLYDTSQVMRNLHHEDQVYEMAFHLVWDVIYMLGRMIEILHFLQKKDD